MPITSKLVNPNPALLDAQGQLAATAASAATLALDPKAAAIGTVADGVSKLLVVIDTKDPVTLVLPAAAPGQPPIRLADLARRRSDDQHDASPRAGRRRRTQSRRGGLHTARAFRRPSASASASVLPISSLPSPREGGLFFCGLRPHALFNLRLGSDFASASIRRPSGR